MGQSGGARTGRTIDRVLALCLLVLLAGCGASTTDRDYTIEELAQTVSDAGHCDAVEVSEDWADCVNESIPGGGLSLETFHSSPERVLGFVSGLSFGCGTNAEDEDNYIMYVFGETWHVAPSYTFEESDVPEVARVMKSVANATGGERNTIGCQDLFERLLRVEESFDGLDEVETAEVVRAALGEPGSDPSLLNPGSG